MTTPRSAVGSLIGRYPSSVVPSGSALFRQDDCADRAYYIHHGQFALSSCTVSGHEAELGRAAPGDLLGIESICSPHYLSTALCTRTARISALPRNELLELVAAEPDFAAYVLERAVHEVCDLRETILSLHCRCAIERVALYLSRGVNEGRQQVLVPWGSRFHLARKLGMTQETLSRTFRKLTSMRIITLDKDHVTIVDPERLLEIGSDSAQDEFES